MLFLACVFFPAPIHGQGASSIRLNLEENLAELHCVGGRPKHISVSYKPIYNWRVHSSNKDSKGLVIHWVVRRCPAIAATQSVLSTSVHNLMHVTWPRGLGIDGLGWQIIRGNDYRIGLKEGWTLAKILNRDAKRRIFE